MTDDLKTPEQMAVDYCEPILSDEYAKAIGREDWIGTRCVRVGEGHEMYKAFLAGYQAGCTATQTQLAVGEEVISELLAKPQWISVEERLPEYDQLVLIWHPDFEKPFVGSRVDSGLMNPLYWWRCEFDMYEPEGIITYWMPLPKPPEKGG